MLSLPKQEEGVRAAALLGAVLPVGQEMELLISAADRSQQRDDDDDDDAPAAELERSSRLELIPGFESSHFTA